MIYMAELSYVVLKKEPNISLNNTFFLRFSLKLSSAYTLSISKRQIDGYLIYISINIERLTFVAQNLPFPKPKRNCTRSSDMTECVAMRREKLIRFANDGPPFNFF